jgi:hypothetical protein
MLNLEVTTRLSREEAIQKVKRFFGEGGHGLVLRDENHGCLSYEGGGGYVTATVTMRKDGTRIDLVTQEWEYQVREFAAHLGSK